MSNFQRVINPKSLLRFAAFVSLGLLSLCYTRSLALADRPPNIIVLLADDLGYAELRCYGQAERVTPAIDTLSERGTLFTQAYVTAPNCSPSRAGLLSGRFPTRFGYELNPIGAQNEEPGVGIPASEMLLPEMLRRKGYMTGLVGKWHLGGSAPFHPLRHGFDSFFGFMHEGHFFAPEPYAGLHSFLRRAVLPGGKDSPARIGNRTFSAHMGHDEPAYDADNPIVRNGQPVVEESYLTDAITREAIQFIENNSESPFFLLVAYNAVHSPMQAPEQTLEGLTDISNLHRRIFLAMLQHLDHGVRDITSKINELGIADETLLIFLSDNGGPTRELTSSNLPLRGEKGSMYEGGLRVPFIVVWPEKIPAGRVSNAIISSTDIFATIAAITKTAPQQPIDGRDLISLLDERSEPVNRKPLYWRQGNKAALRNGDYKIVSHQRSIDERWELYDLSQDIGESKNLAESHSDLLRSMIEIWNRMDTEMKQPLF